MLNVMVTKLALKQLKYKRKPSKRIVNVMA